jgi:hypothetical protein
MSPLTTTGLALAASPAARTSSLRHRRFLVLLLSAQYEADVAYVADARHG